MALLFLMHADDLLLLLMSLAIVFVSCLLLLGLRSREHILIFLLPLLILFSSFFLFTFPGSWQLTLEGIVGMSSPAKKRERKEREKPLDDVVKRINFSLRWIRESDSYRYRARYGRGHVSSSLAYYRDYYFYSTVCDFWYLLQVTVTWAIFCRVGEILSLRFGIKVEH